MSEVNVVAEMNEYLGEHRHKSVPYVGGLDIVRVTCEQLSVWRNHVERLEARVKELETGGGKEPAGGGGFPPLRYSVIKLGDTL